MTKSMKFSRRPLPALTLSEIWPLSAYHCPANKFAQLARLSRIRDIFDDFESEFESRHSPVAAWGLHYRNYSTTWSVISDYSNYSNYSDSSDFQWFYFFNQFHKVYDETHVFSFISHKISAISRSNVHQRNTFAKTCQNLRWDMDESVANLL